MNNITVIDEDDKYWFVLLNEKKYRILKSPNIINLGRGVVFHANYQSVNSLCGLVMIIIAGQTTDGLPILKHSTFSLSDDLIDDENMKSQNHAHVGATSLDDGDDDDDVFNFSRCVRKTEYDLSRGVRSKHFALLIKNSSNFNEGEKEIFGSLSRRYRSHFLKEEYSAILQEVDPSSQLELLNALRKQKTRFYGIPDVLNTVKERIKAIEDFLGVKPQKHMKKMMSADKHNSIECGGTLFFKGEERVIDGAGKIFTLENNDFSKIGFNKGDQVFWLYFEDLYEPEITSETKSDIQQPPSRETAVEISDNEQLKINWTDAKSALDYFNAVRDYYNIIALIKANGIKPRHTLNEIKEIKEAEVVCDGRKKLEGCSWIAYNEDTLWYISNKLSAVGFENNMKINDQQAQCWRISMRHIKDKMESLLHIDKVMYKGNLIPDE